jgi:hypothetical protein
MKEIKLNVEDSSEPTSRRQRRDHDGKHLVVDNVARMFMIERIDHFVKPVVFIPV